MPRLNSGKNVVPARLLWLHRMQGAALADPRETAAELGAWDTHQRWHHSHRPPKVKLSSVAVGLLRQRHCLRLLVILSCHLCYSLHSTERTEIRLLSTELFLLKWAAFQVQLKWEVFSLDWLASELHGARSHLKMYVHVLHGSHSRGISKQENKKPRNSLRLKNVIQNVCDILLHMAQNCNF